MNVANLWDKRDDESKNAYEAFLDYLNMGKRSLRVLLSQYEAQKSDKSQTRPPVTTWSTLTTWSVRNEWQKRANAWDEHVEEERKAEMLRKRKIVEDNDFEDYQRSHQQFVAMYEVMPLHERNHEDTVTDPGTGEKVRLVFVKALVDDFRKLEQWGDLISRRGRRAVGLPETVSQTNTDVTSDGQAVKGITVIEVVKDYGHNSSPDTEEG